MERIYWVNFLSISLPVSSPFLGEMLPKSNIYNQRTNGNISPIWDPVCPVALGQKLFKINEIWVTLDKKRKKKKKRKNYGQWMDLTKVRKLPEYLQMVRMHLHVLIIYTNFHTTNFNSFWLMYHLSIFPYKSTRDQSWSLNKKIKGQLRVISASCCIQSFNDIDHSIHFGPIVSWRFNM